MGIYMDYNSPIYREKYLKYKKKYMVLKEQEAAGLFEGIKKAAGSALDSTKRALGQDPQSKFNATVATLLDADAKEVKATGERLTKGLLSNQQAQIRDVVNKKLASGMFGMGKGAIAVGKISGTHDAKGPIKGKETTPAAEYKKVLKTVLKVEDAKAWANEEFKKNVKTVHEAALKSIQNKTV